MSRTALSGTNPVSVAQHQFVVAATFFAATGLTSLTTSSFPIVVYAFTDAERLRSFDENDADARTPCAIRSSFRGVDRPCCADRPLRRSSATQPRRRFKEVDPECLVHDRCRSNADGGIRGESAYEGIDRRR
jgi:hypothetical protein